MDGGFIAGSGSGGPQPQQGSNRNNVLPTTSNILRDLLVEGVQGIVLYRHRFSNVTMVGKIVEKNETATKIEVKIKDPFGPPIVCYTWRSGEANNEEEEEKFASTDYNNLIEGNWIRVFGVPKKTANISGGEPGIQANMLIPLTGGLSEITGHLMEVMVTNMMLKKMAKNHEEENHKLAGFPNFSLGEIMPFSNTSGQTRTTTNNGTAFQAPVSRDISSIIKKYLTEHTEDSADGVGKNQLISLPSLKGVARQEIDRVLEELSSEGHIYTTIDDDHFKSTDV